MTNNKRNGQKSGNKWRVTKRNKTNREINDKWEKKRRNLKI